VTRAISARLQILRPHLTGRVLASISNTAWHNRGTQGEDPIKTANAVSKELDARAEKKRWRVCLPDLRVTQLSRP